MNPEMAPAVPEPVKPAAVLVALVERPAGLSVLLTRRSDTLRKHTGQVEKTHTIRVLRKDIARLETILTEKKSKKTAA